MKSKALKRQIRSDTVLGGLLVLPLLASFLPGSPITLSLTDDQSALSMVAGIVIWTVAITWFIRYRQIKDLEIVLPALMLISGMVVATLVISASLGLGLLSIFLACALPYLYSAFHLGKLKALMSENSEGANNVG